eukprot:gene110-337_t
MAWLSTNFATYAVEFSPFRGDLIAVSSAQYYGIVGNGKQSVFRRNPANPMGWDCVADWLTKDGVYDCAWSEQNEHVLATAQGDGTIKLFDISNPAGPILNLHEHQQEVYGVDWNLHLPNLLCSASWDQSCMVWDVAQRVALRRYRCHQGVCYAAIWSPRQASRFASVAGDGMLNIYDTNQPGEAPAQALKAHQFE